MTILEQSFLTVSDEDQGQRLDAYLAQQLPDISRTRVKALILDGHIKVNGITANPSLLLKPQTVITAEIPPIIEAIPQGQAISLNIVYEDDDLLVVNKAAGMVVHPAPGHYDNTLVNALIAHCGESLSGIGGVRRPGLVHRLDKGTSGLIVIAKHDKAHRGLALQFAHRTIKRTYHAVVWGLPSPTSGIIDIDIGRCSTDWRKRAVVIHGGKKAITEYAVLRCFGMVASLIECHLQTGRTHQIRVHLTHKMHALVGDPQYGKVPRTVPSSLIESLKQHTDNLTRPCLHASALQFYHPITNELRYFNCDMPNDIQNVIKTLEQHA